MPSVIGGSAGPEPVAQNDSQPFFLTSDKTVKSGLDVLLGTDVAGNIQRLWWRL